MLLYVAFFLYEDEEARIQNRLEQIWTKINALQSSAMSKEVAFLQGVTRTTSAILDRLLGHKLVSVQSVAVSMAFSMASLLVWHTFAFRFALSTTRSAVWLFCALILIILGSLRPTLGEKSYHVGLASLVICLPWLVTSGMFAPGPSGHGLEVWPSAVRFIELVVLLGVLVDILFIAFFRWVLRNIAGISSFWVILLYFIAVSLVTGLLTGPAVIFSLNPSSSYQFPVPFLVWLVAYYTSTTNLVDALCLLLLLVIMLLLLAHRLVWPLIKRPIYAANRKQLIKNTKLLGALGAILLLYAFPNNPVVRWIVHFLPNLKR